MQNSSRTIELADNPKFQLLDNLIKECYLKNVNHSRVLPTNKIYNNDGPFCPRTFDGFACWDATPASATAMQPCPEFVIGFDPRRFAFKRCTDNGTWFMHPEANKPWTNYTTCVDVEDLDFRNTVNNIYITGYSISVAALVLSLIIFIYFRSLQCTRIRIHMHLFTSFALNNVLWILWYRAVVNQPDVVQENRVFVKDDVAMRWFVALGWGGSLLIVTAYSVVRYHTPGATDRCWMEHSDTFWIIIVPVVLSLFASFVFLVNVVRVLLTKLHPAPNQHASLAAKKAARAALILIPLFGLHFVLIPLRPTQDSPVEKLYQIVSALLTSLQGLCVAVLFCFTNHDVMTATKTQLSRMFRTNDAIAMTGITGGESLVNTRDNVV
ncbi:calcitonin gene-related peptide type 1 receptor-like isoform X2 [Pectinophora gossypiella]|uniref:calcitonin gene-related peptide type 1 receptor-like isoform X2 n=1 Tax=Pectinophora gossypiella TaxID=13191 RepID=UPI00214E88E6|nr:calcitonin gene-related peptide type 1 receptor-like isoform X2 [Pectinophora gossypiella]